MGFTFHKAKAKSFVECLCFLICNFWGTMFLLLSVVNSISVENKNAKSERMQIAWSKVIGKTNNEQHMQIVWLSCTSFFELKEQYHHFFKCKLSLIRKTSLFLRLGYNLRWEMICGLGNKHKRRKWTCSNMFLHGTDRRWNRGTQSKCSETPAKKHSSLFIKQYIFINIYF